MVPSTGHASRNREKINAPQMGLRARKVKDEAAERRAIFDVSAAGASGSRADRAEVVEYPSQLS
jgi:hypothetical protein